MRFAESKLGQPRGPGRGIAEAVRRVHPLRGGGAIRERVGPRPAGFGSVAYFRNLGEPSAATHLQFGTAPLE